MGDNEPDFTLSELTVKKDIDYKAINEDLASYRVRPNLSILQTMGLIIVGGSLITLLYQLL